MAVALPGAAAGCGGNGPAHRVRPAPRRRRAAQPARAAPLPARARPPGDGHRLARRRPRRGPRAEGVDVRPLPHQARDRSAVGSGLPRPARLGHARAAPRRRRRGDPQGRAARAPRRGDLPCPGARLHHARPAPRDHDRAQARGPDGLGAPHCAPVAPRAVRQRQPEGARDRAAPRVGGEDDGHRPRLGQRRRRGTLRARAKARRPAREWLRRLSLPMARPWWVSSAA